MIWFMVMASLVTSCSSMAVEADDDAASQAGVSVPSIDSFDSADLQARAFMRACGSHCVAAETTADMLRDALGHYTAQVEYLTKAEIDARFSDEGAGADSDSGALIEVSAVRTTEHLDVRAVDVSISREFNDYLRQTYLFLWDGTAWVNTSPEAVGVTVTSAVS